MPPPRLRIPFRTRRAKELAAIIVLAACTVAAAVVQWAPRAFTALEDGQTLVGRVRYVLQEQHATLVFEAHGGPRYERSCKGDSSPECAAIWMQAIFAAQAGVSLVEPVTLSLARVSPTLRVVELRRAERPFLVLAQSVPPRKP